MKTKKKEKLYDICIGKKEKLVFCTQYDLYSIRIRYWREFNIINALKSIFYINMGIWWYNINVCLLWQQLL